MKNICLLIITLNFSLFYCQKNVKYDSIFVFQEIGHGGITAAIRSNFSELEKNNIIKKKLQNTDLTKFNEFLSSKKSKKLFQQKYGGENYYLINFEEGKKNYYVIGWSTEFVIIDNLTKMRRWIFKNSDENSAKTIIERYCR